MSARRGPSTTGPGELERAVLEQLWESGEPGGLTAREVLAQLTDRGLAYTTVMTVLDRLAKKGMATRQRDGRAWRYRASATREEMTARSLRSTLDEIDPSGRPAMLLHLLGDASSDELDDLREALRAVEQQADAEPGSAAKDHQRDQRNR